MKIFASFCFSILCYVALAQELPTNVTLNQLGFFPGGRKVAIVASPRWVPFEICSPDLKTIHFKGKSSKALSASYSSTQTVAIDFSDFNKIGTYVVRVPGVGISQPFEVRPNVLHEAGKASIKFFYYQRFSTPLPERFAGKWARRSSNSHTKITIHPSAESAGRAAGTFISSPKGWIDAGDYNKYIVNSGITTSTLLLSYEDFPTFYDTLELNIPESTNKIPDVLDETLWNLRWMLTMQDPGDGGVYHKCTNARFSGMVNPDQETSPRYVVQKSTAAALNLAAVTAQASVLFRKFEKQLPGLADSCARAAKAAFAWAKANPNVLYDQRKMNEQFDPDVVTGEYGDKDLADEWAWSAMEMFAATSESTYLDGIKFLEDNVRVPSWNSVRMLAYYRAIRMTRQLPSEHRQLVDKMKQSIFSLADEMVESADKHPYQCVMGMSAKDFVWGSNAVAANQSIVLLNAYRLKKDVKYLNGALSNIDYILGRNATGYSYVTGYGDKTPMHPHHRPSEADGIKEPIPGMLSGGPNPGMQDKCKYTSTVPDEAFVDDVCSYASNEVAINWNAPLVYVLSGVNALQSDFKK